MIFLYFKKNLLILSFSIAERLIKTASTANKHLVTCILRPAAIFGIGDKLIADKFILGQDLFYIGSGEAILDWTPVQSVAHAHILAEEKLATDKDSRIAMNGKAYFISNNESFAYRWFNGAGTVGKSPKLSHWQQPHPQSIPLPLVKILALINETFVTIFGIPILAPALSQVSIDYTQRTYTFSTAHAEADFGYEPVISVQEAIKQLTETNVAK